MTNTFVAPSRRSRRSLRTFGALSAALLFSLVAGPALAQPIIVQSTFDTDRDGWDTRTDLGLVTIPTWVSNTGNPDGCISIGDPDGGLTYWRAPAKFLGNKSAAYRGTLSFDLIQNANGTIDASDVILQGAGIELHYSTPNNPESFRFTRYHVVLSELSNWKVGSLAGATATAAQIQQVLANLTGMLIRAEYLNGSDTDRLDNVILRQPRVGLPFSTFDTDTEDWDVLADAYPATWLSSGGNPGGAIQVADIADGRTWRYLAPGKFLGDLTAAFGGTITFDISTNLNDDPLGFPNLSIESGSTRLEFTSGAVPVVNVWNHNVVPLYPTSQWKLNGVMPTSAQFLQVLTDVTLLEILGEFSDQHDTGKLDNVFVNAACAGDLNNDQQVDDADFVIFIKAYNILDCADPTMPAGCPSDFNHDGVVDDSDFVVFVGAYNQLVCP